MEPSSSFPISYQHYPPSAYYNNSQQQQLMMTAPSNVTAAHVPAYAAEAHGATVSGASLRFPLHETEPLKPLDPEQYSRVRFWLDRLKELSDIAKLDKESQDQYVENLKYNLSCEQKKVVSLEKQLTEQIIINRNLQNMLLLNSTKNISSPFHSPSLTATSSHKSRK